MKTVQVTQRIGELLGPVDWSYDFASHGWDRSPSGGHNPTMIAQEVEYLRAAEAGLNSGHDVFATCYSVEHRVIAVGMYDGWPYWRPVPSFCVVTFLGSEWHPFTSILQVRVARADDAEVVAEARYA